MANGLLYNGYAAIDIRIAPAGSHMPTKTECDDLVTYLGGNTVAGGKLKEAGTDHWLAPNTGADNSSKFTALGAGSRDNTIMEDWLFNGLLAWVLFWTQTAFDATQTYALELFSGNATSSMDYYPNNFGFSIRCIKDTTILSEGEMGQLTDIDGNDYPTICINGKEWMTSNLEVTKLNDGTPIPEVTDNTAWAALITPGRCWYDNIIPTTTAGPSTTISLTTTAFPWNRGITISHKLPTRVTSDDLVPYVIFSVNPGLGSCYEFIDLFISASYKPSSVIVALDRSFTDPATIVSGKIKTYNTGWYNISKLPKTAGGKVLIGKVLFIKVIFPDHDLFYDLKIVRTGYREIIGG